MSAPQFAIRSFVTPGPPDLFCLERIRLFAFQAKQREEAAAKKAEAKKLAAEEEASLATSKAKPKPNLAPKVLR